jgi:hypothetical protein
MPQDRSHHAYKITGGYKYEEDPSGAMNYVVAKTV